LLGHSTDVADIIAQLEKALVKALADKGIQEKFINSGAELVPDALQTSKGFTDYIKSFPKSDYADDAQVTELVISKAYGAAPATTITIAEAERTRR